MNLNQYTQKSTETLQRAQALAIEYNQQTLEQPHLLLALLENPQGLIPQLLTKMQRDTAAITKAALDEVEKLPRVQGLSREQNKAYISKEMDDALQGAAKAAQSMKDEYVSVEHLFMGLLENSDRPVKQIFTRFNVNINDFLTALNAVRGATRVTSDNPEDSYDALN